MIQNRSESGTMWCDDIFLRPVRLNPQYFWYRHLLLILGAALAIAFIITFKAWQNGGWLVLVLFAAIILGVLCSKNYIGIFANILNVEVVDLKHIGHLLMFLLLGAASSLLLRNRLNAFSSTTHAILLFIGLSLFAVVTELIQLVTFDRNPTVLDWLIDLAGIFFGISLAWFLLNKNKVWLWLR